MNLYQQYKQVCREFHEKWNEYSKLLEPYRKQEAVLQNKIETAIMSHKIYMPYEEMTKLEGDINAVEMIVRYGEGYERIESFDFIHCRLIDGEIVDTGFEEDFYWEHIEGNKYEKRRIWGGEVMEKLEVLGCYNLYLDNELVKESSMDYLWEKIDVK